jgi:hypothetical protein
MTPAACRHCRQPLTARHPHGGRGLGEQCYGRIRRAGQLDNYPRTHVRYTRAELLEDWPVVKHLSRQEAARRLGTTYTALDRMLQRAAAARRLEEAAS